VAHLASIIVSNEVHGRKELARLVGILKPGSELTPEFRCGGVPATAVSIFFGSSQAFTTRLPFTLIEAEGRPFLIIERDDAGNILLTADILDKDGRFIAKIVKGRFEINPNNIMSRERPDSSTLILTDQHGRSIYIRYLNPKAIKFVGTLYFGQDWGIQIDDDSLTQLIPPHFPGAGVKFRRMCFENVGLKLPRRGDLLMTKALHLPLWGTAP
jgi:hypothetical protein